MQESFLRRCLAHTSNSGLVAAVITATIISAIMVMMIMMNFLKHLFIYSFLVAKGFCYCPWAFASCREQGLFSTFHAQNPYCDGFSCGRAWTLDLWLSGCGTWAGGIFLDQGLNQCPLRWQADS